MRQLIYLTFLTLLIVLTPTVLADIISINYGGDPNMVVLPGGGIEGFFSGNVSGGTPPWSPDPIYLNSSDGSNYSTKDIKCTFFVADSNHSTINTTVIWRRGGAHIITNEYVTPNGTYHIDTMSAASLNPGEVWTCHVWLKNNYTSTSERSSNPITILSKPGGSPGGGGPSSGHDLDRFDVTPNSIILNAKRGSTYLKPINVTNEESTYTEVAIKIENISTLVSIENLLLNLASHEIKRVDLIFDIPESISLGEYTGQIIFTSSSLTKTVDVKIIVGEKPPEETLNYNFEMEKEVYKPEENLVGDLGFLGLDEDEIVEIEIEYWIVDFENNVIFRQKEIRTIGGIYGQDIDVSIPDILEEGRYVIYTKIKKGNLIKSSFDTFKIEKDWQINFYQLLLIAASLLILILLILFLLNRKKKAEISGFFAHIFKIAGGYRKKIVSKFEYETTSSKMPKDLYK